MKIYFAGSIRGGRDDAALYHRIIKRLQGFGTVLTEHVGNEDISWQGEQDKTVEEIYQRDVDWLRQSDLVVAEVTQPSLGVGYELGLAEHFNIPVICLYRPQPDKKLSAMIAGNSNFEVHEYTEVDDVVSIVKEKLQGL